MNFLIPDNMPDKKLTDAEIVKALEDAVICVGRAPFVEKQRKGEQLKSDVLDLINHLQAENTNLKGHLKQLKSRHDIAKSEIDRLRSKVNRLKRYDEQRDIALHSRLIATSRAEAYKEFEERLKRELPKWLHPYIGTIRKEMVGEE